ncbi:uncharacterized protein ACRADG_012719 [Cochliomyia hominivorax]
MSCICQYFVHSKDHHYSENPSAETNNDTALTGDNLENNDNSLTSNSNISASELSAARAENWILNKNLSDAHITIENLESLVKTIMDKQNVMLSEMYHLKRVNQELEDEARLQRDYHTMERNAMIRELYDVRELLQKRTKLLEETLQKNNELTNAVQDAHEKIYTMGIKYLRLKGDHDSYHTSEQSESEHSSDEAETE